MHRQTETRSSRYAVMFSAFLIYGGLQTPPAEALTVLPGIPGGFPTVGFGQALSAVRYSMSGGAIVIDPSSGGAGGDGFGREDSLVTSNFAAVLTQNLGADVQIGTAEALVTGRASAGFGTLRAAAVASGGGGFVDATAGVTVSFIDVIEIGGDGQSVLNFDINWKVGGTVSATRGSATAFAQLWIFPFGPLPPQGVQFAGNSYVGSSWSSARASVIDTRLGEFKDLPTGSKYWLFGQLSVFASRGEPVVVDSPQHTARADFMDTVELFIDPSRDSPAGAFLTSASGHTYASPVPVPGVGALLGLCVAGCLFRRK